MTDITISDEAVEAAAIAIYISVYPAPDYFSWAETPEHTRRIYINHARAALRAGLAAWPGMFPTEMEEAAGVRRRIILPLPQEKQP